MKKSEITLKIVGILGSPRKNGNSEALLDAALKAFDKNNVRIERIVLNNLDFRPCIECGGCDKTGICVLKDDLVNVYKKVKESDILIIASPIFFGNISALTKMLIDRFQCIWVEKYILKKYDKPAPKRLGAFIAVSGSNNIKFFKNAESIIKIFFAVTNTIYADSLFIGGCDKKGDINKNNPARKKAYKLGLSLLNKITL